MDKCFITKYDFVADNNNLPYFDAVTIYVSQSLSEDLTFTVMASSPVRVFAEGDCTMYVGNNPVTGNDTMTTNGVFKIKNKQENIYVRIVGRSKLTTLLAYSFNLIDEPVEHFKEDYVPGLTQLQAGNVSGNIYAFHKNIHLTNLALQYSDNLTGDMKALVNALWTNGKRDTMMIYYRSIANVTNQIPHIGADWSGRGVIHFVDDNVTYPNGWYVEIPSTGKYYDSDGNEISAPQ